MSWVHAHVGRSHPAPAPGWQRGQGRGPRAQPHPSPADPWDWVTSCLHRQWLDTWAPPAGRETALRREHRRVQNPSSGGPWRRCAVAILPRGRVLLAEGQLCIGSAPPAPWGPHLPVSPLGPWGRWHLWVSGVSLLPLLVCYVESQAPLLTPHSPSPPSGLPHLGPCAPVCPLRLQASAW